jgi:hypothetical protein
LHATRSATAIPTWREGDESWRARTCSASRIVGIATVDEDDEGRETFNAFELVELVHVGGLSSEWW